MTVESVSFEEASQLSTSESHEAEQSIRVPRGGVQSFRWRSTWVVNRSAIRLPCLQFGLARFKEAERVERSLYKYCYQAFRWG